MNPLTTLKGNKLLKAIIKLFALDNNTQTPTQKPIIVDPLHLYRKGMDDDPLSFGKYLAIALPPEPNSTGFASDEEVQKFALAIAEKAQNSLTSIGVQNFELVELYLPPETERIITNIFDSDVRISSLEQICTTVLFGAGGQFNAPGSRSNRVKVVRKKLSFHAAFDPLLYKRLLVRPLGMGKVPVPLNPGEADWNIDQLLIGVVQVFDIYGNKIDEAPIWAWRALSQQNTIIIDVDFDLMARAFEPEMHAFPLGLNIRCGFNQKGQARIINSVSMDLSEAKCWIEYLDRYPASYKVMYYLDTGGNRSYKRNPLSEYPQNICDIKKEKTGEEFPLGKDSNGSDIGIDINRQFGIIMEAGQERLTYRFGFFDRALNYVPAKNIMKITGQLIPEDEETDVMIPPSIEFKHERVFRLKPIPNTTPQMFNLSVESKVTFNLVKNGNQPITPGSSITVSIGDEIEAKSSSQAGGVSERYVFSIQDTSHLPGGITSVNNKRYTAFVRINAPREFVLYDKEHIFGKGRYFNDNVIGIEPIALIFKRPWVFLRMLPGPKQKVLYINRSASPLSQNVQLSVLPPEGIQLDLNAIYEVYVSNLQITLDLKATPSSSTI